MPRRRMARTAPRRRLMWARYTNTFGLTTSNSAFTPDLLFSYQQLVGADVEGTTITRIRGQVAISLEASSGGAAVNFNKVNFGIRVADSASMEQLETDAEQHAVLPDQAPGSDWMYARSFLVPTTSASATYTERVLAAREFELDIKSQRRFDEVQQSLYLFTGISPGDFGAPTGGQIRLDIHTLLKRP